MQHVRQKFFEAIPDRVSSFLKEQYGITIDEALNKNPKEVIRIVVEVVYDLLDEEPGQDLLFNGLNSTTMIFRAVAREDKVYQYIGKDSIPSMGFIHPSELACIEKDAVGCQEDGCTTNNRSLWCVTDYEVHYGSNRELCNFCASTKKLCSVEKCLSNSIECKSCSNQKLAQELYVNPTVINMKQGV